MPVSFSKFSQIFHFWRFSWDSTQLCLHFNYWLAKRCQCQRLCTSGVWGGKSTSDFGLCWSSFCARSQQTYTKLVRQTHMVVVQWLMATQAIILPRCRCDGFPSSKLRKSDCSSVQVGWKFQQLMCLVTTFSFQTRVPVGMEWALSSFVASGCPLNTHRFAQRSSLTFRRCWFWDGLCETLLFAVCSGSSKSHARTCCNYREYFDSLQDPCDCCWDTGFANFWGQFYHCYMEKLRILEILS